MASMTAKAYLTKLNEICKAEEGAGRCMSTDNASRKNCPLWKFKCGFPTDKKHIDTVIELVKSYEATNNGNCSKCGRDIAELINNPNIKFCPYCGEKLQEE